MVVDFDHHSDEFNLNELQINAELRRRCPVAWNENYGGFWFVTSYEAVAQIARDGDTFAHKYEPNAADGVDYQGEMGCRVPRASRRSASARSTAPTTRRYGARLPRSSRPVPSSGCDRSCGNRRTGFSTSASGTGRWTWCSTTPARCRPS
ncbi:putative cytochrome P450 [Mycobacterium xenopi 3993]|nr:putative cytochrome P450 [Mycobacterium xenopi 3993]